MNNKPFMLAVVEELKSKSLGVELIYNLTHQLEGRVEVNSQNGLEICIIIPDKTELIPADAVVSDSTTEGIRL
jgi:hypothetical protein